MCTKVVRDLRRPARKDDCNTSYDLALIAGYLSAQYIAEVLRTNRGMRHQVIGRRLPRCKIPPLTGWFRQLSGQSKIMAFVSKKRM